MKKLFSIILTLLLLTSLSVVAFADGDYRDTANHWAKSEIAVWSDYGVLKGNDDGTFAPDRSMTRGEFAVVLDRVMKYQTASNKTFADLDENFYTQSILRLHQAGVMNGYDGKIMPNDIITREEAAVMLCRALGIQPQKTANQTFADTKKISSWAKEYLNALVNRKLMNGDGTNLNPGSMITRAEVVKIMDNTAVPVLKSGTVENLNTGKILIISAPDVTLKGCEITGDVLITQGVTSGAVAIVESNLKGYVSIDNTRKNFITITDSQVADTAFQSSPAVGDGTGDGSQSETPTPGEDKNDDKEDKPATPPAGGGGGGGGGGGTTPGPVTPTKYTVKFMYGSTEISKVEVAANGTLGDKIPANPVADKEGYIFEGWFDGTTQITGTTRITKNTTAIAKISGTGIYKVTFIYNGETFAEISIPGGSTIGDALPGSPVEGDEYKFLGWYVGNTKVTASTKVNKDMEATAKVEKNPTYIVDFVYEGTTIDSVEVVANKTMGNQFPTTNPVEGMEGYTFLGWYDEEGVKVTAQTTIRKNMTLNAKVTATFIVSFYYNDALYDCTQMPWGTVKLNKGETLGEKAKINPLMGRDGEGMLGIDPEAFYGWKDENGNLIEAETPITGNLSVYADIDYALANDEMLKKMQAAWDDMDFHQDKFPEGDQRNFILTVMGCIQKAIPYQTSKVLDSRFIRTAFPEDVGIVKGLKDSIEANGEQTSFNENLGWLDADTGWWLIDAFDVNVGGM